VIRDRISRVSNPAGGFIKAGRTAAGSITGSASRHPRRPARGMSDNEARSPRSGGPVSSVAGVLRYLRCRVSASIRSRSTPLVGSKSDGGGATRFTLDRQGASRHARLAVSDEVKADPCRRGRRHDLRAQTKKLRKARATGRGRMWGHDAAMEPQPM